ncbi:hypothetical protein Ancab_031108 [Ancistrocladus abbreviatus]
MMKLYSMIPSYFLLSVFFLLVPLSESEPDINVLSFTELRDKLLALYPLNEEHIIKVNQAESEFWSKSEGYRVGWGDEILGLIMVVGSGSLRPASLLGPLKNQA